MCPRTSWRLKSVTKITAHGRVPTGNTPSRRHPRNLNPNPTISPYIIPPPQRSYHRRRRLAHLAPSCSLQPDLSIVALPDVFAGSNIFPVLVLFSSYLCLCIWWWQWRFANIQAQQTKSQVFSQELICMPIIPLNRAIWHHILTLTFDFSLDLFPWCFFLGFSCFVLEDVVAMRITSSLFWKHWRHRWQNRT